MQLQSNVIHSNQMKCKQEKCQMNCDFRQMISIDYIEFMTRVEPNLLRIEFSQIVVFVETGNINSFEMSK